MLGLGGMPRTDMRGWLVFAIDRPRRKKNESVVGRISAIELKTTTDIFFLLKKKMHVPSRSLQKG